MRQHRRSISTVSVLGIFVLLFSAWGGGALLNAQSASLTDDQRGLVRASCAQIKGSLSQLHASDALLRVNRGQVYESMSSKLMVPFNTRLSSSGLDNKAMATHTTQYGSALTSFRNHYISYEQKLAEALKIDCRQNPDTFYQTILDARELRNTVHSDVEKLHGIITDYGVSVNDFLLNYKRLAE